MTSTLRDEWITLDGLNFFYRDWGGSGQPVVLLHGLASTCHIWDQVAPLLAEDYRVIAMDQRGHGESAKPDYGYDFASVGKDLEGLLEGKDLRNPIIVGHSWGGDVALEFAVSNPEMPGGLCFIDGGMIDASSRHASLQQAREQMAPPDFTGVNLQEFLEMIRREATGMAAVAGGEEVILANFEILAGGAFRAKLSRENHLRIVDALWDHHPAALYPAVKCPVLIMPARQQGHQDALERESRRSRSVDTAADLLPVSKTLWLEDSIHDVPVQRPQLVASLIKEQIDGGFFSSGV